MDGEEGGVSAEAVREALRRILASPDFDASERNRRFLRHIVEETLAGRAARIKAYSIATSVFGRDADFDPQLDSIVRIEAGRLRRALERYYLTAGQADAVRIAIPRGGYVPVFHAEREPAGASAPGREPRPRRGCAILVCPFEEEGDHSVFPNFSRGLTRHVIVGLTRFTDLFVFGAETVFGREQAAPSGVAPGEPLDVDLLLTGGTTLSAERFTLEVLLSDARSGRYIWGDSFDRRLDPGEITRVRDEVANSVVRSLAQPYGVIFNERAREVEGKPPTSLTSYDSVIRFYQYERSLDPAQAAAVQEALEAAIRREPDYAEAYACLAQLHVDRARFARRPGADAPRLLRTARDLALRAVELAPRCSRSRRALALAHWFSGDVALALEELRTGLSLNPNDTEIMSELGLRHAVRMEWDEAVPLLRESYARNPVQPGNHRIGLALHHHMQGRHREALEEMRHVTAGHFAPGLVVMAAAAAKAGLAAEAEAAVRAIERVDPGYGDRVVADLTARNVHPEIIAAMVEGLREAGLPGQDTGLPRAGEAPGWGEQLAEQPAAVLRARRRMSP